MACSLPWRVHMSNLPPKGCEGKRDRVPSDPTRQEIYRAAKSYRKSGLSFIPIRADGTKMPAIELLPRVWDEEAGKYRRPWGGYREHPPSRDELRDWFKDSGGTYGLAILGGAISGNLEIIDLDNWGVVEPWMKKVRRRSPILL